MLEEIKAEFLNDKGWKKTSPLDRDTVRRWMDSSDIEVLGATNRLLFVKEHLSRVHPSLSLDEILRFRKHYCERCLRESSEEGDDWEWADRGFNLNHQIVDWFADWWKDKNVPRAFLVELKDWLAQMLADPTCGQGLQAAVYDHLLGDRKIGKFFNEWRNDPQLKWIFGPDK